MPLIATSPEIEIHEAEAWEYYDADSEARSIARGFTRQYSVEGQWPRDPANPADEVYFRLARGEYEPYRRETDWALPSWDAALARAADYEARGAAKIILSETDASLVEEFAAEAAVEARS